MSISISESDISRESLLAIPEFDENTKKNIADADILIVPKFVEHKGQILRRFPAETADFVKLAIQKLDEYNVSLCENEGDERSYSQQFAEITIPAFLITHILLPLAVGFVVSYISHKFISGNSSDESTQSVSLEIIVEENEQRKKISYTGPISGLKEIPSVYNKTIGEKGSDTDSI